MKSFPGEIYCSHNINFQWKTKTPPCPTEKTKNKQNAVYWLVALKRKMYRSEQNIFVKQLQVYMHCHVWHAKDFSQNFLFLCIHLHTHILSLKPDNLVQKKK